MSRVCFQEAWRQDLKLHLTFYWYISAAMNKLLCKCHVAYDRHICCMHTAHMHPRMVATEGLRSAHGRRYMPLGRKPRGPLVRPYPWLFYRLRWRHTWIIRSTLSLLSLSNYFSRNTHRLVSLYIQWETKRGVCSPVNVFSPTCALRSLPYNCMQLAEAMRTSNFLPPPKKTSACPTPNCPPL